MSLSFITFLSIFKYVFNISVLKWARLGSSLTLIVTYIRDSSISCQAFICFPWPVDIINFQGLFIPLVWLSTGYSFKPLGEAFVILMVSNPERTNSQVI